MNEVQVWVLIGVFASIMIGGFTLQSTWMMRVMRAELGRIETKFDSRFDVMDERFTRLDQRLDHIDRDVQALTRRVFREND